MYLVSNDYEREPKKGGNEILEIMKGHKGRRKQATYIILAMKNGIESGG